MWVHVDDLPTPIVHGWKGIYQSIEVAEKNIKKIEAALEMRKPPADMFHKKGEFVFGDLWSRHEDIVEAWCDRLEDLASIVPDEITFDKKRLVAWSRLSAAKKQEEIDAKKKWSKDMLRRVKACEQKATKLKLEFQHNSHADLYECKDTAEDVTDIYTKKLKEQTGPVSKRRKVENKRAMKTANKYDKVDEQLRMDTMFFSDYLQEFRNAFSHCMSAYPGGTTHAANMSVHLIKAGVVAVRKATSAGRHQERFRLLAALTFAAFEETMWFTETEDDEKDRKKLINLIAKEWQQLIGSKMWNPTVLKVRSKMVLDQTILRLDEAREFVQEWAEDVDATVSFDYKASMGNKSNGKKFTMAMKKAVPTAGAKTRVVKVTKKNVPIVAAKARVMKVKKTIKHTAKKK